MDVGFTAHNVINVGIMLIIAIIFCREVGKW
jgi:hypothetical protein